LEPDWLIAVTPADPYQAPSQSAADETAVLESEKPTMAMPLFSVQQHRHQVPTRPKGANQAQGWTNLTFIPGPILAAPDLQEPTPPGH